MSEAKYTDGPWHIATGNKNRDFNRWSIRAEKHPCGKGGVFPIANVNYTHCRFGQANARLIAAAPEMLDALKEIMADMDSDFGTGYDYNKARAAIAKATGAQS